MAEEFMHKNKLQEYAQRSAIPLPIYNTVNEGSPHAPRFRSSVIVDGAMFSSNFAFSNKKAAEQYVAKYALEAIRSFIRNNSLSLIPNVCFFSLVLMLSSFILKLIEYIKLVLLLDERRKFEIS